MQPLTPNLNETKSPLSLEGVPLLHWPKDVFPYSVEEFVKELSRSTETPIELSSMLVIAVVAVASQKKYRIQIKRLTPKCNPGPLTEVGKMRQKMGSWKHGLGSKEAIEERRVLREIMKNYRQILNDL